MRNLSIPSMMLICGALLETHRSLLEGQPLLATLLPELEALSTQLAESRYDGPSSPNQADEVRLALRRLDEQHDQTNRTLFTLLDLAGQSAKTDASREAFLEIQTKLYPNNLAINRSSYETEAGEAIRLGELLAKSPDLKKTLSQVALRIEGDTWKGDELLKHLAKIGHEMQDKLQTLNALQEAASTRPTNTERQARLRFFQVFQALQTNAALVYGAASSEYTSLFRLYNDEVRKQKGKSRPKPTNDPTPAEPPTPSTDPTPED